MTLLEYAILRAKFASDTPDAVVSRPMRVALKKPEIAPDEEIKQIPWRFPIGDEMQLPAKITCIKKATCFHFGVTGDEFKSGRKFGHIVYARHIAMYVARKCFVTSSLQLARYFGYLDHTAVIYGWRKIEALQDDEHVAADCEDVERAIGVVS